MVNNVSRQISMIKTLTNKGHFYKRVDSIKITGHSKFDKENYTFKGFQLRTSSISPIITIEKVILISDYRKRRKNNEKNLKYT